MTAERVARRAGGLVVLIVGLTLGHAAGAADGAGEVRVLSGPGATSVVTIRALPDIEIDDRTPGAKPPERSQGPVSTGETFTGELTLFLHAATVSRPAAIDVGDPVVSAVRLFPEKDGTTVTIFVRQPVTYSVSRPSPIGEVRIELKNRTRPLTLTGATSSGTPRYTRPTPTGSDEVAVDAQSLAYDQQTNTLTARGDVTLTRGDTTLTADEVVYDKTNAVTEARGHVVVTDPQGTVEGDFMHMNLDDESGWVDGATATMLPTRFVLGAERLVKKGGPCYSVANGVFTTCECGGLEKPSWSVAGRQTDVDLSGAGVVHGMTFRVKDVPVLYLPYFVFPANNQRQSGFLIPRLGYSNRRGFQYEQPFFWAISKSTDATVAVDVETAARVGLIGDYRYVLSRQIHGQFLAAYYNEQIRGGSQGTKESVGVPADVPENRFVVAGRHLMPFYGGSKFYLDLFAVSDDQFLREINTFAFAGARDVGIRTTRYTTSDVGVIKTWPESLAWFENVYHQDLQDPQDLALQKLPRVEGLHAVPLFGERAVVRLAGEAVDYQRQQGYDGLRADLGPELLVPFHLGRALNGSLAGQLRETAYHLTDGQQVALIVPNAGGKQFATADQVRQQTGIDLPNLDANHARELAQVDARVGTEFHRVFTFQHLGLEKLKHTIEPEMQYLYVPQVGRPIFDRQAPACHTPNLPGEQPGVNCDLSVFSEGYLFDQRDAINRRNFLSYGITTKLFGRAATASEADGAAPAPAAEAVIDPDLVALGVPADAVPGPVAPAGPPAGADTPTSPPRELVRASILHGYDVSRSLVGTSHQSDVDIGLRLTPLDYLALSYNTTVNLQHPTIRGLTVGAVAREFGWTPANAARNYQTPSTIGVSYRFIEKSVNQATQPGDVASLFSSQGVNEIDGSVYLRLGGNLGFTFLSRYDLNTTPGTQNGKPVTQGPHFLERDYLLRLISRCNCWVVEAGVADKTNPDERLFRVQLTLIGLGSFGQSPAAAQNYVGFAPVSQLGLRAPSALGGGGAY